MRATLTFITLSCLSSTALADDHVPTQINQCTAATITELGTRLTGVPDSGSSASFSNGISQFGYDTVPQIVNSRIGDRVITCLIDIERNCTNPKNAGHTYSIINTRTMQIWTRADSSHQCNGA